MRKTPTKLTLASTTIRALQTTSLDVVAGGRRPTRTGPPGWTLLACPSTNPFC
jgi:hypothetical protein